MLRFESIEGDTEPHIKFLTTQSFAGAETVTPLIERFFLGAPPPQRRPGPPRAPRRVRGVLWRVDLRRPSHALSEDGSSTSGGDTAGTVTSTSNGSNSGERNPP